MTDPTGRAGARAADHGPRVSRRTFLLAAGLAATAPAAVAARTDRAAGTGPPAAQAAPGVPAVPDGGPLSIGYLAGSDGWPALDRLDWRPADVDDVAARLVLPAARLGGDGTLRSAPLLLTFHALLPGLAGIADPAIGSVELDVDLPAGDAAAHRFHAWSARLGIAPAASGRTRIVALPGHDGHVVVTLALAGVDGRRTRRGSLGPAGVGVAGLRRGAYLLALGGGTWDRPRLAPPPGDPRWRATPSFLLTVDAA